jgi:hypothetical protein
VARDTGKLLQRALDDADTARAELRRARGDLRRYRGKSAKTKARNRIAKAERKIDLAVGRVDRYAERAADELPTRREKEAREWEIGFSYHGAPRSGKSVTVNARITKRGGGIVTQKDAERVVKHLHEGGSAKKIPGGLVVHAVDWQRPGGRMREGRPSDLDSFSGIMQTVFSDDFRLSPVEDDE